MCVCVCVCVCVCDYHCDTYIPELTVCDGLDVGLRGRVLDTETAVGIVAPAKQFFSVG